MRRSKPDVLGYFVVGIYRLGNWIQYRCKVPVIKQLLLIIYKIVNLIFLKAIMGVDIPSTVQIGKDLVIYHPQGIVITPEAVIGEHATIHHQVTIGNQGGQKDGIPTIGDYVEIGAGAKIIGELSLGNNVRIGANAVVTKSFSDDAVLVGVPAKRIR